MAEHNVPKNTPSIVAYGTACLLGLAVSAWLYPLSFILGWSGFFQQGDAAQHVSGWLLYAADVWRYPLLRTNRVVPDGLLIYMTDSIPLVALALKPFSGWLPDGFHYFGLWHVVIALGQALGGVYLIRSLGARSLVAAIAVAIIALTWPANLFRVYHTALGTHCTLLVALGFYFRAQNLGWSTLRAEASFFTLSAMTLLIHPYLAVMVLAVQAAFTLDRIIATRTTSMPTLGLVLSLLALAALAWPLGYFAGGAGGTGGFEFLSMNLLFPFCGGSIGLCGQIGDNGYSYEGLNYLGLGALILLGVSLWLTRKRILPFLLASPGFSAMLLTLAIYAVSNRIWLGAHEVFNYTVPEFIEPVIRTFRAPGRFFWLVGYAIMAFSLAAVLISGRRWAVALVLGAVVLQWIDTSPARQVVLDETKPPSITDFKEWQAAFPDVTHIEVYPGYACTALPDAPYAFLQLLAGELKATINTVYQARAVLRCDGSSLASADPLSPHVLAVSLADRIDGHSHPSTIQAALAADQCLEVTAGGGAMVLCSSSAQTQLRLLAQQ